MGWRDGVYMSGSSEWWRGVPVVVGSEKVPAPRPSREPGDVDF